MQEKVSYLSILYLITWCISPPLSYGAIYRVLAIIAVILIIAFSTDNALPQLKNRLMACILLSAYMIIISIATDESFTLKIGAIIILLTSSSFALWNFKFGYDVSKLRFLVLYTIILFCIWNTTTLYALDQNPHIMRDLVRNMEGGESTSYFGAGGYGYLYSAVLTLPIGLYLLRKEWAANIRLIAVYFVLSSAMMVYQSQYFMALIIAILIIPMMYLADKYNGRLRLSSYILIFSVLIIIFACLEPILDFLISVVDIRSINHKLVDMQNTLLYGGDIEDSDFGIRYERYVRDFILIFQSPIWGVFKFSLIGKHSAILDFMAQYGIPLSIPFIKVLFSSCNDWIKRGIPMASVILWIAVIIALMNPITLQLAVPLCIIMPAFCKILWLKSQSSITQG